MSSDLSPTARAILGMLRHGARTGYDIKRYSELSTRFFWGASYGQIYPELRRLEAAGLVEAEDDPRGGVPRRAYRLTESGEERLREWLTDTDSFLFEYRDETLLRFFFGDLVDREDVIANLRARRAWAQHGIELFRSIEPLARADAETQGLEFPLRTLEAGIEFMEWIADWSRRTEEELSRSGRSRRRRKPGTEAPARP